ncbi:MAG: hypothetical protein U0L18_06540 [Acutalibacteraceae bacterium]|nr:hypothetical protein [Acutalibacteraceae bacterium]
METPLFYAYLKYQKDNQPDVWKFFLKLPKHIICIFILIAISIIVSIITAVFEATVPTLIALAVQVIAYLLMYYFTEKHLIKFSESNYNKYCDYCEKLNIWLKEHSINSDENIDELLQRFKVQISEAKSENEKSKNRFDKWLQTLVIPIILAIITTIITKQDDLVTIINPVIVILMVFVVLYVTVTSIAEFVSLPEKRRIEQMQCFANDLQGVLDYRKKSSETQAS